MLGIYEIIWNDIKNINIHVHTAAIRDGHRFRENDNLYSRYKKYPSKKYICAKIKIILGLNLNGRSLVPRRKILTEIL